MNKRYVVTLVLLGSIAASASRALAQEPAPVVGTWSSIKALPSKDELTVTLRDGSSKKGKVSDVTDTALILSRGKKLEEISRESIFQISRSIPKSRSRGTGVGAMVGAALGGITAAFGDGSSGHGAGPGVAIAGVALMAGVGALIGRGLASSHEQVLIYEARR